MLDTSGSRWIFRPTPKPECRKRLFCFPYAGVGGAAFRTWGSRLPPGVELCAVRLPGRESRLREPPVGNLAALVAQVVEGIHPFLDRPFVFFGHSMGAVLAFEVTRRLRAMPGAPMPEHLVVSAHAPPTLPMRHPPVWHLPDGAFLEAIQERYGEIPAAIAGEPDLLRLLLPCLKADVAAVERHPQVREPPLDLPITVLGGSDDPTMLYEEGEAWARETTGPFSFVLFPGDHFFIQSARDRVLDLLAPVLTGQYASSAVARVGS